MSHPKDHPDPRMRKLAEQNSEIHRRYEAEKDAGMRIQLEKQQLDVKKAMQQIDPSNPDIAHDVRMHQHNIDFYEDSTRRSREAESYRGDD
jgi:hypothetical protein